MELSHSISRYDYLRNLLTTSPSFVEAVFILHGLFSLDTILAYPDSTMPTTTRPLHLPDQVTILNSLQLYATTKDLKDVEALETHDNLFGVLHDLIIMTRKPIKMPILHPVPLNCIETAFKRQFGKRMDDNIYNLLLHLHKLYLRRITSELLMNDLFFQYTRRLHEISGDNTACMKEARQCEKEFWEESKSGYGHFPLECLLLRAAIRGEGKRTWLWAPRLVDLGPEPMRQAFLAHCKLYGARSYLHPAANSWLSAAGAGRIDWESFWHFRDTKSPRTSRIRWWWRWYVSFHYDGLS